MVADVARRQRAEQRIGDGVDEHVGVGVSLQTFRMRDLYATEHERSAFDKSVHVVADAGESLSRHKESQ